MLASGLHSSKSASNIVADRESEAAMQVDALFDKFDTDSDGTISRTEFEIALRALNVHPEQHKSVNKIDESS